MPELREVCFLVGRGGAVLWADASDSPSALPDRRTRWEAIWALRDELEEISHSHPLGPAAFSREDETTMDALDSALGRAVRYSVVAPRKMIVRAGDPGADAPRSDDRLRADAAGAIFAVDDEPWWAHLLRLASGMKE